MSWRTGPVILNRPMNAFIRLIAFGAVSGLVWGVVPLTLTELWQSDGETLSVLLAGVLTGIAVTLLLFWPLHLSSRWRTVAIGATSLPLGAFLFGIIALWIHFGLARWPGVTYQLVQNGFDPLQTGLGYALGSLTPLFAIVLIPLAVVTTVLQHRVMHGTDDMDWA